MNERKQLIEEVMNMFDSTNPTPLSTVEATISTPTLAQSNPVAINKKRDSTGIVMPYTIYEFKNKNYSLHFLDTDMDRKCISPPSLRAVNRSAKRARYESRKDAAMAARIRFEIEFKRRQLAIEEKRLQLEEARLLAEIKDKEERREIERQRMEHELKLEESRQNEGRVNRDFFLRLMKITSKK